MSDMDGNLTLGIMYSEERKDMEKRKMAIHSNSTWQRENKRWCRATPWARLRVRFWQCALKWRQTNLIHTDEGKNSNSGAGADRQIRDRSKTKCITKADREEERRRVGQRFTVAFTCHLLRLVLHRWQRQSAGVITAQSTQAPAECHCQGPAIRYGPSNGYLGRMATINYQLPFLCCHPSHSLSSPSSSVSHLFVSCILCLS